MQSNLNYRCQQNFKILRIFTNQLPISEGFAAKRPGEETVFKWPFMISVLIDS